MTNQENKKMYNEFEMVNGYFFNGNEEILYLEDVKEIWIYFNEKEQNLENLGNAEWKVEKTDVENLIKKLKIEELNEVLEVVNTGNVTFNPEF